MKNLLLLALLLCSLSACDKKISNPFSKSAEDSSTQGTVVAAAQSLPAAASTASAPSGMPDVGKVEQVSVTAKGAGLTPGAAVNEALKNAVMQVNGVAIDSASANLNVVAQAVAQVDVDSEQGHDSAKATATLNGKAYADAIVTQSHGVISSFQVTNVVAPQKADGLYTVDILAKVAKFSAPADAGKIKIVIAPIRIRSHSFDIGGHAVSAQEVAQTLHRKIVDALTQTGRFTILDREYAEDVQRELDLVASGQTVNTDVAKLGQALSADLIWIGELDTLAYTRHARQLRSSDRELVSYSGGWSLSQRMINVTTRQIQQSSTLQGKARPIAPTTMSKGIDVGQTLTEIESAITKKATETIVLRTFPVSIVERTGDHVVLSQGSSVLKPQARYRVYVLGKEVKDPKTGRSLGKTEQPCCELVINRVTQKLSYATLENVQVSLDNIPDSDLQLREAIAADVSHAADEVAASVGSPTQHRMVRPQSHAAEADTAAPATESKERDDW